MKLLIDFKQHLTNPPLISYETSSLPRLLLIQNKNNVNTISGSKLCDWAYNNVGCEWTYEQVQQIELPSRTFLYITIDDTPSVGANETLDAFNDNDLKATFFVNSANLEWGDIKGEIKIKLFCNIKCWYNSVFILGKEAIILREIAEGHIIADHSYDHMSHNNANGEGFYQNVTVDASYFGTVSFTPILSLLQRENVNPDDIVKV